MDVTKLFSTSALHPKSITACGETFTVHVRRLPAVDLRKFHAETMSPDREEVATAGFHALVKSIRNEDGTAFATFEQYKKMDGEAISELLKAFTQVNGKERDPDLGNS
jgi:hypothetical protein